MILVAKNTYPPPPQTSSSSTEINDFDYNEECDQKALLLDAQK